VYWGGHYAPYLDEFAENLSNVKAISLAGPASAVFLFDDGSVSVFPDNQALANVPQGLSNVQEISCSSSQVLALETGGHIAAGGNNNYGQCNVPESHGDSIRPKKAGNNKLSDIRMMPLMEVLGLGEIKVGLELWVSRPTDTSTSNQIK
jgi:hypothetical protein